jgi:hypothetical protein
VPKEPKDFKGHHKELKVLQDQQELKELKVEEER